MIRTVLALLVISGSALAINPEDFVGNYELVNQETRSFNHPDQKCSKNLTVSLDGNPLALGLNFTGEGESFGYYISRDLLTHLSIETRMSRERLTLGDDHFTKYFESKNGGVNSVKSTTRFELNNEKLKIIDKLTGYMRRFSYKLNCTYRRL